MPGQGLVLVEHQVALAIESDHLITRQLQLAKLLYLLKAGRDSQGIHCFWQFALQTKDQCLVGTMPLAGCAQRAVQFYLNTCELLQQSGIRQPLDKHACGTHGSHGMRA